MLHADPERVSAWRRLRAMVADATPTERDALLHEQATWIRRSVVSMIDSARQGHIGGDFSVTDILATLYFAVLDIDPGRPEWPERDRYIQSKGHAAASLYSTLARCGFFPPEELDTFMAPLSPLNGHPNRNEIPGVETNTGPLGHGLPVAVGTAIGAKLAGRRSRTFVALGDGEMQEGSNWEALMAGAHHHLDNLTAIIDRNRLQQGARTEDTNALDPLDEKLAAFNWEVRVVDGHDYAQLLNAFGPSTTGRPVAVVANTIKGHGVSFIEDRVEWHHKVPDADQVRAALEELV